MALTNAFYEAVNSGNVRRVRMMMKDSLLVNPSFEEFKEMENTVSSMQGLYDSHDGRAFEMNETAWDDDYMDKQMVQVVRNFSHERIEHLKNVVRYLRPVTRTVPSMRSSEIKNNDSINRNTSYNFEEQKSRDKQECSYKGIKIATGAVAGAVVGGLVASAVSLTVVGGAVTGAVVGGGVAFYVGMKGVY